MNIIWWIPSKFWETVLREDPTITPEGIQQIISIVDRYSIFAVVDGEIGPFGGFTPIAEEEIRKSIKIRLPGGKRLTPLPDLQISAHVKFFFAMMKPMFTSLLGQMGEGYCFMAFKGKDTSGKRYLNPKTNSKFSVLYKDNKFDWRLPLGSLLPAKIDPVSQEEFPGNYIYNPFTGKKLITKSE